MGSKASSMDKRSGPLSVLKLDIAASADAKTASLSTLCSEPSDDKLRELVEATAEITLEMHKQETEKKNGLADLFKSFDSWFSPGPPPEPPLPRIDVNLCHCETEDEHRAYVADFLDKVKGLHGDEGLKAAGFEYRMVHCAKHATSADPTEGDYDSTQEEKKSETPDKERLRGDASSRTAIVRGLSSPASDSNVTSSTSSNPCVECATRLFYAESNTVITEENRKRYIADGDMYEEVTRICQECAQEAMQREGNLEWITVCDDPAHCSPVRALVHEDHPLLSSNKVEAADDHPTLLIATGKGKVKAGIFSRRFLLTSGMEASTALPLVTEAARRNMSVVIFDPNARGDRNGMDTFEKSFEVVLGHLDHAKVDSSSCQHQYVPSNRALYIVAHSASGSQLVRHMLDRAHGYLPYLRAIAFTDSTHNIQWAKNNAELKSFLSSPKCVYFRSASKHHDDLSHCREAGQQVETDTFWEHRFGSIKTLWAGTEEHSLMNWFAHGHIWEHFDQHMIANESAELNRDSEASPPSPS